MGVVKPDLSVDTRPIQLPNASTFVHHFIFRTVRNIFVLSWEEDHRSPKTIPKKEKIKKKKIRDMPWKVPMPPTAGLSVW